jgi:hypothetical protein
MEDYQEVILSGAIKTYDAINTPEYKLKRFEAIRKARKKARMVKKDKSCTWQTTEAKDGKMIYWCITHGVGVPMTDNPNHETYKTPTQ